MTFQEQGTQNKSKYDYHYQGRNVTVGHWAIRTYTKGRKCDACATRLPRNTPMLVWVCEDNRGNYAGKMNVPFCHFCALAEPGRRASTREVEEEATCDCGNLTRTQRVFGEALHVRGAIIVKNRYLPFCDACQGNEKTAQVQFITEYARRRGFSGEPLQRKGQVLPGWCIDLEGPDGYIAMRTHRAEPLQLPAELCLTDELAHRTGECSCQEQLQWTSMNVVPDMNQPGQLRGDLTLPKLYHPKRVRIERIILEDFQKALAAHERA